MRKKLRHRYQNYVRSNAYLRHERPQPSNLQLIIPLEEILKTLVPGMYLEQKLTEGKGRTSSVGKADDRLQRLEFPPFEVDFENIDVRMA